MRQQRMSRTVGALVVAAVLASVVSAAAQPGRGLPPPGDAPTMTPAQVQQLFDAMIVMQAQETLALSEDQYGRFLTRLRVLQNTRRKNLVERARIVSELQRLTNERKPVPGVTDADIKQQLTRLVELDEWAGAELRKAYASIDEVLDVRQQARFRVFEEQIERRKLELVARARQQIQQNRRPPR